ncbi:MAG: ATP-binding cassette domain-containing protein, partial [Phreatobacter sp.]|uniref:ATP-binding cassette domain-containing protein n=1 Tax=Phreatobacter sp. TaxID=1966341 RepID=UPI002737404B
MTAPLLALDNLAKSFTMHLQGGLVIPVISGINLTVAAGECVVLGGPSGAGKSSVLKM